MPVSSRSQRAEAKYNVTTEFPHLGLHSAASTGNIGLVKYALSHGQPINSVIDGVLPLHCACSGGNALVVKLLIDSGADVNAPRLPRRYSPAAPRSPNTTPAPIVGTSGSTPLHFAAANGHTAVVRLLLQHGARPGRPDKHGITPEMVARQNGWVGCAEAIGEWVREKDRDLRERETILGSGIYGENGEEMEQEEPQKKECMCWWSRARDRGGSMCSHCEAEMGLSASPASSSSVRKRLHMKRSIDNVLQHIKSSSTSSTPTSHAHSLSMSNASLPSSTPPTSTSTTRVASPDDSISQLSSSPSPNMLSSRRPSLPTDDPSAAALGTIRHKQRRPSSAGTGSASPSSTTSSIQAAQQARKLGSKYSLLHLFRRGSVDTDRDEGEDGKEGKTSGGILRGSQRHQRSTSGSSTPPPTASSMKLRFSRSRSRSRTRAMPPADEGSVGEPESDDDEEEYGEPLPISARAFGLRPRGQSMNSQLSRYSISADELGAASNGNGNSNGNGEEQSLAVPEPDAPGRTRGDSASSVSVSARSPSPATPPALPYTTTMHASPGPMELPLPAVREREKAHPGDIDLRAISSHAQAEALVQRTQAEVLALAGAGVEAGGLLSARLAAYGESLAIERRMREQDGGARTSASSEFERPLGGARSTSMDGVREGEGTLRLAGQPLGRTASVGAPGAVPMNGRSRHAGRSKIRRPHTSGSMTMSEEFMPSPGSSSDHHHHHHHHHRSRSAAPPSIAIHPDPDSNPPSALEFYTASNSYEPDGYDDADADEHRDTFPVPAPLQISTSLESGFPSHPPSRTPTHALTLPVDAEHPPRSRTPDPETPDLRVGTGHALCRVLTAPDLLTPSSPTGPGRHIARKNKLAKMGFTGVEAGGGTPPGSGGSGRFGGFRNLMASLKGKP